MATPVDIWFPTYIGDFFTVTASMTGHEVGAYQLIIAHIWKAGGAIKANDKQLAKLVKANPRQWAEIKETLWPMFEIEAGMLVHAKTTIELAKATANRDKKRLAGIASGRHRRAMPAEQMFKGCSANAEPRAVEGEGAGPDQVFVDGVISDERPFRLIEGGSK